MRWNIRDQVHDETEQPIHWKTERHRVGCKIEKPSTALLFAGALTASTLLTGMLTGCGAMAPQGAPEGTTVEDTAEVDAAEVDTTSTEIMKDAAGVDAQEAEEATTEEQRVVMPGGEEDLADQIRAATLDYMTKVSKAADIGPEYVRYPLVDDFDHDGEVEGLVFVGEEADREWNTCYGEVWFVNENTCEKIHDSFEYVMRDDGPFFTFDCGSRAFLCFDDSYATQSMTNVYYLEDGKLTESRISRLGDLGQMDERTDFALYRSAYDNMRSYEPGHEDEAIDMGHTWKPYYFYYDADTGDFAEYVGEQISATKCKELVGMDLTKAIHEAGYDLGEIYLRGNGIINVNYRKITTYEDMVEETFGNASYDTVTETFLDAWGEGGDTITWEESDYGGVYEAGILDAE